MPEQKRAPAVPAAEAQENSEAAPYVFQKSWEALYAQSLETRAYSVKAWDVQRRARASAGNAMEPREPGYFGRDLRIAARMCDLAYADPRWWLKPLDSGELLQAALDSGIEETERERTARLTWMLTAHEELEERLAHDGIGAVYDFAELTTEERIVIELQHAGKTQVDIAQATGKAHGTVKALLYRAQHKLRALAEVEAA